MKEKQEVIQFFKEMRSKDDQEMETPSFDQMVEKEGGRRMNIWIPLSIAASVGVILLVFFGVTSNNQETESVEQDIVLMGTEESETTFELIENRDDLLTASAWESPTSSLVEDF